MSDYPPKIWTYNYFPLLQNDIVTVNVCWELFDSRFNSEFYSIPRNIFLFIRKDILCEIYLKQRSTLKVKKNN